MLRSHLNINGEKALQKETCIRKERWFLFLFNKPQESKRDKVNFQITALSNVLVFFKKTFLSNTILSKTFKSINAHIRHNYCFQIKVQI